MKEGIKLYNYSEEESQDLNDKIAIFYGGIIEQAPMGGEQYRFDPIHTLKDINRAPGHMMKCPPFGVIPRTNEGGQRVMVFHQSFQHLMPIIHECWNKVGDDARLLPAYQNIGAVCFDFSFARGRGNTVLHTHRAVCDFIYEYNRLNQLV